MKLRLNKQTRLEHKALFALAVPMILSNITVPLLGLVDTAVIGHLSHAYYLGATAVGAMIITFVTWFCGFLRMSTTGLSAQAFGADDKQQQLIVILRGCIVAFVIAILVLLLQTPFVNLGLYLAGGSDEIQLYAKQYIEIRVWGYPASLLNIVILGWLLGNQKAASAMWLLIVTNLINISLDLLFVLEFAWQVKGVAIATVVAEYSGLIFGLYLIIKALRSSSSFVSSNMLIQKVFDRIQLHEYFKLNFDIIIRTLCLQLCFMFITFQGARMGDVVVAANSILMNFLLLISFGLDGIANGAEARVGKAVGAKDHNAMITAYNVALIWTMVLAGIFCLFFAVFGRQFIDLISSISEVNTFAQHYLPWIILLPLVSCWCFFFDGIYIALMQAKVMRNSMIIATFACFFPAWFLLQGYGNHGLWAAFSIFMLARGLTLGWHFYYKVKHQPLTA